MLLALLAGAAIVMAPSSAFAWGAEGHKLIMRRAIELLPPEIRPFFEHFKEELVLRSNDPDLWRNIPWDDDANHFIDFGIAQYGKPPFTELPRELGAAQAKFGATNLKKWGMLPWRVEEFQGSLRRAFEGVGRRGAYSISDVVLFSAVGAHYLQDATQPFHATNNYDGQLTGNNGIHSRFERDLIEKFGTRLRIQPPPVTPIANARDLAFDRLIESYGLVDRILQADKAAIGSKDTYDDGYFQALFASLQPMIEKQYLRSSCAHGRLHRRSVGAGGEACALHRAAPSAAARAAIALLLVHLIPLDRDRYELYAEPPEIDEGPLAHDAGRVRRWLHKAGEQWRDYVDAARMSTATSGFAKWRDAIICRLAQTLDEQRTLRSLRTASAATVLFPSTIDPTAARAALDRILAASLRHHGQWLIVYLVLFVLSGILFFIPGPNIVAYYLGFQGFGHLQSWRGARHAASPALAWTLMPSTDLAELAALVGTPHGARTAKVAAIADRLGLEHLPAFFERAAA
ncbi:MAG: hypothetical protein QM736_01165 [Vicinamibacterales bacterium]